MSNERRLAEGSRGEEEAGFQVMVIGCSRGETKTEMSWRSGAVGPGGYHCRREGTRDTAAGPATYRLPPGHRISAK